MRFQAVAHGLIVTAVILTTTACVKRPPSQHVVANETAEANSQEDVSKPPLEGMEAATPKLAEIQWPPKFTAEQLRGSVKRSIDYLVRTTDDQGKFAYIINTDPEIPPTDEYNVVRHAGTMYGLGMYLERYDEDADQVRATLLKHGQFLRKQMQPVEGQEDMLAIWSDPSVTGLEGPARAELGSAALGLIGLSCVEREAPGSVPPEELTALANFVLFMQREDGGFAARYIEGEGKQEVPVLLFYPGEAALALVLLYEVDENPRWLEAAAQAIAYMSRQRQEDRRPLLDHWMMLATARIWPLYGKTAQPVSREHLIHYSLDLCELLMEQRPVRIDDPRIKGCITGNGMTCPTATRVEGLVAALSYLPDEYATMRAKVRRVSEDAIVFLMNSQVTEGKYRGGVPYAMFRLPEDHPYYRRQYNLLAGEIRIDYVHHAISGMMLYDDVVLRD